MGLTHSPFLCWILKWEFTFIFNYCLEMRVDIHCLPAECTSFLSTLGGLFHSISRAYPCRRVDVKFQVFPWKNGIPIDKSITFWLVIREFSRWSELKTTPLFTITLRTCKQIMYCLPTFPGYIKQWKLYIHPHIWVFFCKSSYCFMNNMCFLKPISKLLSARL